MKEKIIKDRQLLIIFSLLWAVSILWIMRYYPLVKSFDLSGLNASQLNSLFMASLLNLFGIVMTSIYVYKSWRWCNSSRASPRLITLLFVALALFFWGVSIIIVWTILWKTGKLLKSEEEKDL